MTRKREAKDDMRWPRPVWIWRNANGARSLVQAFQSEVINGHIGWQRLQPEEISDDGPNIVGFGQNPQDQTDGWLARLNNP